MQEQTLVIFKPDSVARGLVGTITSRFERVGLKIVAAKMMMVTKELADKHYPASREAFINGMGGKTLENYQDMGIDPIKEVGSADPHEIGLKIREWLVDMITAGPVLAVVLEGPHAVELVRKMVGHTLPLKAAPGTIRGDYSFDSSYLANVGKRPIKNLLHASGELDEAKYEVDLWFTSSEIMNYTRVEEDMMK
ncbi:nucleoside-diphosphate kinase [Candidatus Roizmanbacteria bacterium CG_4_9_14_0_2_um_filter_39_13]|uniref:nucleoside-diphosphate kinase n=1 Tax=Candidatus Roizmanbacteria bacterium CG_4_9_14_0_2_um_filter_39_13 TaxID=1974839 RepID=A0A2M8EX25_9BACT|nr:MAG: nucleoside-diphosphate kinase [Candidatus Roizmanbacteria bacterium CG_4_10_14_0_2_um_filter_39_12]PJC30417.1 MAG: nucleoside-diphosphate kinase [Candidatus Roizmanbacteria bacterium CG_4_9_14_0_2_um_filter_39_13]